MLHQSISKVTAEFAAVAYYGAVDTFANSIPEIMADRTNRRIVTAVAAGALVVAGAVIGHALACRTTQY